MKTLPHAFGIVRRVLFRAGIYLPFLVATSYSIAALIGWAEDMFHVTSTAFAVFIALSGGFFAFSRAPLEVGLRDRIIFGGERALHGALQMLAAAVVEFGFRHGEKLLVMWNEPGAILQAERPLGRIVSRPFSSAPRSTDIGPSKRSKACSNGGETVSSCVRAVSIIL